MAGMLAFAGTANALTAAVFLAVGVRLALRPVDDDRRLPMVAIALWWICMGLLEAVQAAETFAVALGAVDLQALQADRYLNGAFLGVGCWGLAFHVAFVGTGKRVWAARLAPVYVLLAIAHWSLSWMVPVTGIETTAYGFDLVYTQPLTQSWVAPFVLVGVFGTMVIVPAVYIWLGKRLDAVQGRRAWLASIGIIAWGLTSFFAHAWEEPLADFLTITGMAFLAAVCASFAYFGRSSGGGPGSGREFVPVVPPRTDALYEAIIHPPKRD